MNFLSIEIDLASSRNCPQFINPLVLSFAVWDQNRSSRYNWIWNDVTTYDRYTEETSFENSLLVQQTGSLALSSLTHVLRSLTPNARGIFKLLVEYQLDNGEDQSGNCFIRTVSAFVDNDQKCLRIPSHQS